MNCVSDDISDPNEGEPTASTSLSTSMPVDDKLQAVEEALNLNKQMEQSINLLERGLIKALHECRAKLKRVQSLRSIKRRTKKGNDPTVTKQYFNNFKHGNSCIPDNEDTIEIKKMGLINHSTIVQVNWTPKDKSLLTTVLYKQTQEIIKSRINNEIIQLKKQYQIMKGRKKINFREEIEKLQNELHDIRGKDFAEIALPLEQEYDWQLAAQKMKNRHSPTEIRAIWRLYLHPSIEKSPWTNIEHLNLQKITKKYKNQNWEQIAKELNTNRTGYQCFVYHRAFISKSTGKWTPAEELKLKELIQNYKALYKNQIPFTLVASHMKGRNRIQVYNKYLQMKQEKKGRFSAEEDAVILNGVETYKYDFYKIQQLLPDRTVTQIITRFKLISNETKLSMVWTEEEDRKLIQLMANQDSNQVFSSLTKYFVGKTRAHIRSRYLTLSKWLKRHPDEDISAAPRRFARRLNRGATPNNLNQAQPNLSSQQPKQAKTKTRTRKTDNKLDHLTECFIDDEITILLYNRKHYYKEMPAVDEELPKPSSGENLSKLLYLLQANISFKLFKESPIVSKYPCLLEEDFFGYPTDDVQKGDEKRNTRSWENAKVFLPPSLSSITGLAILMSFTKYEHETITKKYIKNAIRKNQTFQRQYFNLVDRMTILFRWPLLLSTAPPEIK